MIDTAEVIAFFDSHAPTWDDELRRNEEVIQIILDNAQVSEGKTVLDVACGTGVLIPDYLERRASSVTGIDISPAMAEIAKRKFPQKEVTILCGDVETIGFDQLFDCVVVYNAFPHFPDGKRLIATLKTLLSPGGILTVAHGMSREKIDAHHHGCARHISNGLVPAEDLAAIFRSCGLTITAMVSDDRMYQIAGKTE